MRNETEENFNQHMTWLTQRYLESLSDQELTELVNDLGNVAFEETAPMRKAINALHGEDVGIFVLRVQELIYPLLKETHLRWEKVRK